MPQMSYNRNNGRQSEGFGIGSIIGLAVTGLTLYAVFHVLKFIGLSVYTAVVSMTVPALVKSFLVFAKPELSIIGCLTLALEGLIVGLCIGSVKRFFKNKKRKRLGNAVQSFISELFTFQIFNLETNLISAVILDMLISSGVSWIAGAGGAVGISQLVTGGAIESSSIIGGLIAGGGAGGVGGSHSLLLLLFIMLIFIVQGIITGAALGLTFGTLFGAISGAIKTGSMSAIIAVTTSDKGQVKKGRQIVLSLKKGLLEGAIVGGIVGFLQGLITICVTMRDKKG